MAEGSSPATPPRKAAAHAHAGLATPATPPRKAAAHAHAGLATPATPAPLPSASALFDAGAAWGQRATVFLAKTPSGEHVAQDERGGGALGGGAGSGAPAAAPKHAPALGVFQSVAVVGNDLMSSVL
jgi:amino acid transporter